VARTAVPAAELAAAAVAAVLAACPAACAHGTRDWRQELEMSSRPRSCPNRLGARARGYAASSRVAARLRKAALRRFVVARWQPTAALMTWQ